jgi:hypothetical protein
MSSTQNMPAPPVFNLDQVPEGGSFQQMYAPQMGMVPMCFVAAPEFCEGMYIPPLGGYEAQFPHGGTRFPSQHRQGRHNRNFAAPAFPNAFVQNDFGNGAMWPQESFGPQEPVAVELSCLPKMLCNSVCLEAAIEQAGLENVVQKLELKSGNSGEATLIMVNGRAAQRCIQHFNGLQWAKSSQPVCACYKQQPQQQQQQQQQPPQQSQQQQRMPSKASKVEEGVATPLTMTPKSTPQMSPKSSISMSPKSSISMPSPSMKPRWADIDSDEESDDMLSKSTFAGNWDSLPASSDSGEASNSEQD